MTSRMLGQSDLRITRIGMGAWAIGGSNCSGILREPNSRVKDQSTKGHHPKMVRHSPLTLGRHEVSLQRRFVRPS
jgi:aryl-alcohol dehydrogenase-like predicted oxidoreductase